MFENNQQQKENSRIKVINTQFQDDCIIEEVFCIRQDKTKKIVFYILSFVTFGFVWLLAYWSSKIKRKLMYCYCTIQQSTHFQLQNWDGIWQIHQRLKIQITYKDSNNINEAISFKNRFITYFYDREKQVFETVKFNLGKSLQQIKNKEYNIVSNNNRILLINQYNQNIIDIPIKSKLQLFIKEMLSPFQVFQFYAIILWLSQSYVIFPIILLIASLASYIYNVNLLQQTLKQLHDQSYFKTKLKCIKKSDFVSVEETDSTNFVPGDLIYLVSGSKLPCDCIILSGAALVNEKQVTGDSYPVKKCEIQNFEYKTKREKQFTLYLGTQILEIKGEQQNKNDLQFPLIQQKSLLCLVIKTNYRTLRGQNIRSTLFPKQHSFSFYEESIKFLLILFIITVIGYIIFLFQIRTYFSSGDLFIFFLDLVSTTIPPTLPIVMSLGISFSIQSLSKYKIKCMLPPKVIVGGRVNTVCFQKTGTITKKQFNIIGYVLNQDRQLRQIITNSKNLDSLNGIKSFEAMASCHAVTKSTTSSNYLGSSMQIQILKFCGAEILTNEYQIRLFKKTMKIIKRFQFSPELQRMAVVVELESKEWNLYLKGQPNKIIQLCNENTLPDRITETINNYANRGYRILGFAYKNIQQGQDILSLKKLEKQLIFLGIIVLQNKLQQKSEITIRKLIESNVNAILISGDNQMTTASVAFSCGMLDDKQLIYCDLGYDIKGSKKVTSRLREEKVPIKKQIQDSQNNLNSPRENSNKAMLKNRKIQTFDGEDQFIKQFIFSLQQNKPYVYSITGRLFQQLFMKRNIKSLFPFFQKTLIFSRMLPKHKLALINYYQQNSKLICLVGENVAQINMFKQADLGLALTQSEQGSTNFPFSSNKNNLDCVIDLLRICRAGLSTNFQTFKMMCLFGIMEFTSMIILYVDYEQLNNTQFLYIDLVIMCPIFITLNMTQPCKKLSKILPSASLLSKQNLISMIGLFFIQLIAQISIVQYLKRQPFYIKDVQTKLSYLQNNHDFQTGQFEANTLFIFTNFLYLGIMITTSISKPFRKEFYTNYFLVVNILVLYIYNYLIPFAPIMVPSSMQIQYNNNWYITVVILGHIVSLLMYLYETILNKIAQKGTLIEDSD